jgi:hypothetical protein
MEETIREGGCDCGAARYRASGEPIFVNYCLCRLCQRQTGSTGVVNAFYEAERIELLKGDLAADVVTAGSGGAHAIHRCGECGTALWSTYPRMGTIAMGLRVGTLDEPGDIKPDAVIFTDSKMPWVALPEDIPAFATTYDAFALLPADRSARLRVLVARRKAGEGG